MKNLVLSAVLALGLAMASWSVPAAQAQYGGHHGYGHSHCGTGYGGYQAGYVPGYVRIYSGGIGSYTAGYGSYRNVPPVVLGQIYSGGSTYRSLPYSSNFGGYYGSGFNGMGYSNFGTGMGVGYGPTISFGLSGYGHRF